MNDDRIFIVFNFYKFTAKEDFAGLVFDFLCVFLSYSAGYIQYCRDHYDNSHCEQGCNTAPCGWDGSDCYRNQYPIWAKGSLILHTRIPFQKGHFQNSSLLWAVSTVLQTSVKFRGMAPFQLTNDLLTIDTRQLADLYAQPPSHDSDG